MTAKKKASAPNHVISIVVEVEDLSNNIILDILCWI